MRVIQILVPCSDDFIGPFATEEEADRWAKEQGLTSDEYLAHSLTDVNTPWCRAN